MKTIDFTLEVSKSRAKLMPLFEVINRSTVLPILETVLISNNGKLSFQTSDLENVLTIDLPSTNKEEWSTCLHYQTLKGLIKNNLDDTIKFTGLRSDTKLQVTNGDFKLTTDTEESGNFPKEPALGESKSIKIMAKELANLFVQAVKFASNDDLRPAMTGVFLHDRDDQLFVVATDAHRLYYNTVCKTPSVLKGVECIIPIKGVRLFMKVFKDEEVEVSIDGNYICFKSEDKRLVTRIIDARFPDYKVVLVKWDLKFSLLRKQLNAFIKIAEPFVNVTTKQIDMSFDKDKITVVGSDMDKGEGSFQYVLPVFNITKEVPKFKFAVNLNLFRQALTINSKDEYAIIEHSGESSKAMVIDDCLLLMPLMTRE